MNKFKKVKYQHNEISFDYPSEYTINATMGIEGRFLFGNKKDSEHEFEIIKKIIDNSFNYEIEKIKSILNADFTIHEERNITIDGVPAYQISYSHPLIGYHKRTVFDKNDVRYIILITGSDPSLNIILESFKVFLKCDCRAKNTNNNSFCTQCGLRLNKSNKNTLQKNVNDLNQIIMQYGIMTSKNGDFSNWQYHKPVTVNFNKHYSDTKSTPESNIIVPPDIISYENVCLLSMFDNEFENNLKTDIFFNTISNDSLMNMGSISLKIYDVQFEETEEESILWFVCDFD